MSRYSTLPSHTGRKVFGTIFLGALAVLIVLGILQKITGDKTNSVDNVPSTAVATPIVTLPPSADLPAPPAPPVVVSSCHKPVDATPPVTTEQEFVDLVWKYEAAYLSTDAVQWEEILSITATERYKKENSRSINQPSSTLTTSVIPDGSVITWKDDSNGSERIVSTIACIVIKDGEQAITLPYSVPFHYTTWVKTESGWRVDRDAH